MRTPTGTASTPDAPWFRYCVERVLAHEGGLSLDPDDRGNWTGGRVGVGSLKGTNFGISAASYPQRDIAALAREDAIAIYHDDFWVRAHCPELPAAVAQLMFDTAVLHGVGAALRMLQRAVGVTQDGVVGPVTRAALARQEPGLTLARLAAARLMALTETVAWSQYGRGWVRRVAAELLDGEQEAIG